MNYEEEYRKELLKNGIKCNNFIPYNEQLLDIRWIKLTNYIKNKKKKCEYCGNDELSLHIHHKNYIEFNYAWEYNIDDLVCICSDCHNNIHKKDKNKIPKINFQKYFNKMILYKDYDIDNIMSMLGFNLVKCDNYREIYKKNVRMLKINKITFHPSDKNDYTYIRSINDKNVNISKIEQFIKKIIELNY